MGRPDWRPRYWEWPSVLCLDAPLIGMAWQALSARALGVRLDFHHRGLLGLALWLAYAADRWLDSHFVAPRTARHRMARHWRRGLLFTWLLVLVGGVHWAWVNLATQEWRGCLGATVLAAVYVLGVARLPRKWPPKRVLQRILAALVLSLGVMLFVWPRTQVPALAKGTWTVAVVLVILANLLLIQRVEARQMAGRTGGLLLGGAFATAGWAWLLASRGASFGTAAWAIPCALSGLVVVEAASGTDAEVAHAWADWVIGIAAMVFVLG